MSAFPGTARASTSGRRTGAGTDSRFVSRGRRVSATATAEDVKPYTFDPSLSPTNMKPILNYDDPRFTYPPFLRDVDPLPSPVLSPDGTRLLLSTKQMWAARRNMNLPPRFTQVEGQSVHDTTAMFSVNAIVGQTRTITVAATDPESDGLTYLASFLEPGMTFNPATRTLTWPNVPGPAGKKYYVKFWVTTASGGTDAIIVEIVTVPGLSAEARISRGGDAPAGRDGPNPTHGSFAITTPPGQRGTASLTIFDLSGRRLALVRGRPGSQLVWDGTGRAGTPVSPGIYVYRVEAGSHRLEGKIVVVR